MNVRRPTFEINLSESFPHLARAPIVEAVIHWSARAEVTLLPDEFQEQLKVGLPDYPIIKKQQEFNFESKVGPEGATHAQRTHWQGFRLESVTEPHIAQFTRNGFSFSRLKPYNNWNDFSREAKRLWQIYSEIAKPSEIERLGVRFINRIVPVEIEHLDHVLAIPPQSLGSLKLPIDEFVHRTGFQVPGHQYGLNVIQANQLPVPPDNGVACLILDIDVYTTETIELNEMVLDDHLNKMHWLKNKVFYTLLNPQMIEEMGGL